MSSMTTTVSTTFPAWMTALGGWPNPADDGFTEPIGVNLDGSYVFYIQTDSSAGDYSTYGPDHPPLYSAIDPTTLTPDTTYTYNDSFTSPLTLTLSGGVASGLTSTSTTTCASGFGGFGYQVSLQADGDDGAARRMLVATIAMYVAPCISGGGYGAVPWMQPGATLVMGSATVTETNQCTSPFTASWTWPTTLTDGGSITVTNPVTGTVGIS